MGSNPSGITQWASDEDAFFVALYSQSAAGSWVRIPVESRNEHPVWDAFFVALIFKYLSFHCLVVRLYSQIAAVSWVRIPAESRNEHPIWDAFFVACTVEALLGPGFESQRNNLKSF